MADKLHGAFLPSDSIHVVHAWDVASLSEITVSPADVGKVARAGGQFFLLVDSVAPTWIRLASASLSDVTPTTVIASGVTLDEQQEPIGIGTPGTSAQSARADHEHAVQTDTPAALLAGSTGGEGTSTALARADHEHAVPLEMPVSVGHASEIGISGALARADHVHRFPGFLADPSSADVSYAKGQLNATTVFAWGTNQSIPVGTPTARSTATTNAHTRRPRLGMVTAAAAGSRANIYFTNPPYTGDFEFAGVCGIGAVSPSMRWFMGLNTQGNMAMSFDLAAWGGIVGIGRVDGSTNVHFLVNSSAGVGPINLGADFPALAVDSVYQLLVDFAGSSMRYEVCRIDTGRVASGVLNVAHWKANHSNAFASVILAATNNADAIAVEVTFISMIVAGRWRR